MFTRVYLCLLLFTDVYDCLLIFTSPELLVFPCLVVVHFVYSRFPICDLASENRPYDIFNLNGVISIML